jgi:hypothetical protein
MHVNFDSYVVLFLLYVKEKMQIRPFSHWK